MPEKDPTTYSFITYAWIVFLSAWGGAISFLRKRESGEARPFNVVELVAALPALAPAALSDGAAS